MRIAVASRKIAVRGYTSTTSLVLRYTEPRSVSELRKHATRESGLVANGTLQRATDVEFEHPTEEPPKPPTVFILKIIRDRPVSRS
jgi:hypothetical protein